MADRKEKKTVCLCGGGPWGFRLQGGVGTGLPLIVSKVRRKSKAYKKLFEGDLILSVNSHNCQNFTYDQVMEIADKSGTDLTLEVLRQESNKENIVPSHSSASESSPLRTSSPLKPMDNSTNTKEVTSSTEMTKKTIQETEGMRIKSATLLPSNVSESSIEALSQKQSNGSLESRGQKSVKEVDPYPLFEEVLESFQKPPVDSSKSSRTEEVKHDGNTVTKTTKETKHEVTGNTETTFSKTQQESVTKSVLDGERISSPVALEALDLNNLINETQKRLDSFKNGFKTDRPSMDSLTSKIELKKTETSTTTSLAGAKSSETGLIPTPFLPFPTSLQDSINKTEQKVDFFQTLNCLNGGLGFTTDETSQVTTETEFGSTTLMQKKKMFSSSSFYEEPESLYPTVEEQVEMARKIADSLADDTNKKSKGANMFYKRVKRSSKWIHEGPEPSDESEPGTPEVQGVEPPTPDPTLVPFRPSKGPPKLKLLMDSRHPLDINALRSSGLVISEHNVVSPDICHGIVKDLQSPVGKGAALFAKRKKKSEEWVVDEERVKNLLREHERKLMPIPQGMPYNKFATFTRQESVKLVKSPWEAAMENPYGLCDAAFARVRPEQLADTVIRAADEKRRNSNTPSRQSSRMEGCLSPTLPPVTPAAAQYDIYHAKAPRGWMGMGSTVESLPITRDLPGMTSTGNQGSFQPSNEYSSPKKMVFQNFNTLPRLWKPTSAH